MEDPNLEKALEKRIRKKGKKKSKNTNDKTANTGRAKAKGMNSKKAKNGKDKENKLDTDVISTVDGRSDVFAFNEIANNEVASDLIYDLVKCFTCNFTLPQKELEVWNKTLYNKTVSVFLNILNNCVEKIFNKLLGGGYLKWKKVGKKDAICQTDVSYDTHSEDVHE